MSQDLAVLFSKGINEHYLLTYDLYPSYIPDIFRVGTMDGRYEYDQLWEGYQLPQTRNPGEGWAQGQFRPSFNKKYVPVNYALGDVIAQEDYDDDEYGVISRLLPAKGGALARAHATLKEIVAANYFKNVAFATEGNNTVGTSDGRPLFSNAHPISQNNTAVTFANRPSVDADFSISTYQVAAVNLRQQPAPNNTELIRNSPRAIVINPNLHYVGTQILKGEWELGTANRNMNVIKQDNVQLIEWPYFRTSGATGGTYPGNAYNAWMMLGREHYLRFIVRQDVKIKTDYAIAALAYVFVSYCRFDVGATDWRGTYGSKGS
jgi:hypothetical protein